MKEDYTNITKIICGCYKFYPFTKSKKFDDEKKEKVLLNFSGGAQEFQNLYKIVHSRIHHCFNYLCL